MKPVPRSSQHAPAAWSGERVLVEKGLARRCAMESLVKLLGGGGFLIFGLVAFVFTSGATATLVFLILFEAGGLLSLFGLQVRLMQPVLIGSLFLFFVALTIRHAYKTRWGTESSANIDFGGSFSTVF